MNALPDTPSRENVRRIIRQGTSGFFRVVRATPEEIKEVLESSELGKKVIADRERRSKTAGSKRS